MTKLSWPIWHRDRRPEYGIDHVHCTLHGVKGESCIHVQRKMILLCTTGYPVLKISEGDKSPNSKDAFPPPPSHIPYSIESDV